MEQQDLPYWEGRLIDEAIAAAEARLNQEKERARKRAVQLGREKAYHRLAAKIDEPGRVTPGQLSLWPVDPTLFDE